MESENNIGPSPAWKKATETAKNLLLERGIPETLADQATKIIVNEARSRGCGPTDCGGAGPVHGLNEQQLREMIELNKGSSKAR